MQKENTFPTDNFKKYSKKYNPEITILEILVYKIQQEIIKSKSFMRFNFITKPCSKKKRLCNKVKTSKEFKFYYFWLCFVYQNFQNGYFWIILFAIQNEIISSYPCAKRIYKILILRDHRWLEKFNRFHER